MPPSTPPRQANFGRALLQLRTARGLTQEDLLMATSRRHMSRIEQGHQQPSIGTIESLAESLQIHPLSLVTAAYCPVGDSAAVQTLLQTVQADLAALIGD
jgi:transcriptional regulator with XRE-family HTH domain